MCFSGTKLLKPPNKLVELVAQAIDSSPDELLQVQQIYTVLQYVALGVEIVNFYINAQLCCYHILSKMTQDVLP